MPKKGTNAQQRIAAMRAEEQRLVGRTSISILYISGAEVRQIPALQQYVQRWLQYIPENPIVHSLHTNQNVSDMKRNELCYADNSRPVRTKGITRHLY